MIAYYRSASFLFNCNEHVTCILHVARLIEFHIPYKLAHFCAIQGNMFNLIVHLRFYYIQLINVYI